MHDSLPTGDLTDLLGQSSNASNLQEPSAPLEPSHSVQPTSSGLGQDSPYHLIIVGGQEVPVGYGGWAGPNWTEIIHAWLDGTATAQMHSSQQRPHDEPKTPRVEDLPEHAIVDNEDEGKEHDRITSCGAQSLLDGNTKKEIPSQLSSPSTVTRNSLSPDIRILRPTSSDMSRSDSNTSSSSMAASMAPSTFAAVMPPAEAQLLAAHSSSSSSNSASSITTTGTTANTTSEPIDSLQSPYILVAKERLMGIYISVWAHRSISSDQGTNLIQASSTGTVTAGLLAGKLGNKGAACVSLLVANTRLLFVCAHLAAHSDKTNARQQNVIRIKEELIIDTFRDGVDEPKTKKRENAEEARARKEKERDRLQAERKHRNDNNEDVTDAFDYTFWFGDRKSFDGQH